MEQNTQQANDSIASQPQRSFASPSRQDTEVKYDSKTAWTAYRAASRRLKNAPKTANSDKLASLRWQALSAFRVVQEASQDLRPTELKKELSLAFPIPKSHPPSTEGREPVYTPTKADSSGGREGTVQTPAKLIGW